MNLFRTDLTEAEREAFRLWARVHYEPLTDIKGVWHPIVQTECVKINREYAEEEP